MELVTDLSLRYNTDIFFSTAVKIIFFQVLAVTVTIVTTAVLLEYVKRTILAGIIESLTIVVQTGTANGGTFDTINHEIMVAQLVVYGIIIIVSILMGFIAIWLALRPVRESLVLQRRFIASVAHELRTPFAILKTQNEVAKLDIGSDSPLKETLDQNIVEIDHVTEILNNLLLFNRVDTLDSIRFEHIDAVTIVETVIARLEKLAFKKRITLEFKHVEIPTVYGNSTGLEQALFNIIKNAINYTRENGKVIITCTTITEREVTLLVSDNGIGISERELPHIFQPFYRTDNGQDVSQGTGLGLALVFEIMKLHNGRIRVESGLGVGTQFQISIPRQPQGIVTAKQPEVGVAYDFSLEKSKSTM